jgi:hypothetical protein
MKPKTRNEFLELFDEFLRVGCWSLTNHEGAVHRPWPCRRQREQQPGWPRCRPAPHRAWLRIAGGPAFWDGDCPRHTSGERPLSRPGRGAISSRSGAVPSRPLHTLCDNRGWQGARGRRHVARTASMRRLDLAARQRQGLPGATVVCQRDQTGISLATGATAFISKLWLKRRLLAVQGSALPSGRGWFRRCWAGSCGSIAGEK